jgi:phytoene dehydrogenase-like protein
MQEITIVGGGLAGMVAAIHVAEGGGRVTLHEAGSQLAGRARTDAGDYRVNFGPHALYRRGAFGDWLSAKKLLPPVYYPSLTGLRMLTGGKLRRFPPGLMKVMRSGQLEAPIDDDYRSWATRELGEGAARVAIGLASLPTYHPDPGTLSAHFVQERIRRSVEWRPVWYIRGGWATLAAALERRIRELGVEVVTRSKLSSLPPGIAIVATDLPAAAKLLGRPELDWPAPRLSLLDVALKARRGDPTAVLALDERVYASNYAAGDASVAPRGESLLQITTGVRDGESDAAASERMERVLDAAYPRWRERTTWRRKGVAVGGAGAVDLPGTSWRDRPAIDQGAGRYLCGDRTAAPGLLAEVSFESARRAAQAALMKAR